MNIGKTTYECNLITKYIQPYLYIFFPQYQVLNFADPKGQV